MISFYHSLALKLSRIRWLLLLTTLAASLWFMFLITLAKPELAQQWQLSSIVIAIISLLAYLISQLFVQPITTIEPQHTFIYRVKIRLQQTFSYLLAILLSIIVLAALFLSIRALLGIIGSLVFK